MALWLGITLGDPSGIGPEVTLKALAACPDDTFKYLILGDSNNVLHLNAALGTGLELKPFNSYSDTGTYFVHHVSPSLPDKVECGSAVAADIRCYSLITSIVCG